MSAVLDLHPAPGHPAAVAAAVHDALDGVDVSALVEGEYAATLVEWERAIRRMEAVKLQLVAAAAKTTVAQDAGCASTAGWLSKQTRSGTAAAARSAQLATDLDQKLPATRADLSRGEISTEHAGVIAHAISRLPQQLSAEQVARVEARLVDQARRVTPTQLRRLARRALAAVERDQAKVDAHEDDQVRDEEAEAHARTRLTLHDNGDGTTTGHFTVPTLAAAFLKKILDAMTAPRRVSTTVGSNAVSTSSTTVTGSTTVGRDPAHDRGLAFAQLLEHLPVDHLHSKVAATIVVTLDLDTLRGQLKAAGLDTGDLVSSATARRLACNAGLVPAVLGGGSLPLDLGRTRRLFNEAQRVAGATHHTACAADGCEVPYAWTELHHRHPWSRGGKTDLDQMVPLCGFHHRRIHDRGYLHSRLPDGSIRFARRT